MWEFFLLVTFLLDLLTNIDKEFRTRISGMLMYSITHFLWNELPATNAVEALSFFMRRWQQNENKCKSYLRVVVAHHVLMSNKVCSILRAPLDYLDMA